MSNKKITLTYFSDNKGRNELTRLIFVVGGIEYESEDLDYNEYVSRRDAGELPYGQIPTLTIDDQVYGQSCSIARYAAKISGLYPTKDDLQALSTDAIVDSWRDVLDLFYDCAFCRGVINGKLSMFPRPPNDRWVKFQSFIATTLSEHMYIWNRMLVENNGQYCTDIFPCWADLAVYDIVKTMSGTMQKTYFNENIIAPYPELVSLVERIDAINAIKKHLEQHPYKDISFLFQQPTLSQQLSGMFLFPILKSFLLPTYLFIKRSFNQVQQKLLIQGGDNKDGSDDGNKPS